MIFSAELAKEKSLERRAVAHIKDAAMRERYEVRACIENGIIHGRLFCRCSVNFEENRRELEELGYAVIGTTLGEVIIKWD